VNFHSYEQSEAVQVANPWMPVDPSDHPQAPCVRIPVTDALRAADAAQRAEREQREIGFGAAWREKLQLSESNLRLRKAPSVAAGRVHEDRRIVIRKPRRSAAQQAARHCSVCQAAVTGTTRSSLCSAHRPRWRSPRVACARGCGMDVACRSHAVCVGCRRVERLAALAEATPKSPRTRKAPSLPAPRLLCPTEGCAGLMRAGRGVNADGTRNDDTCKRCSTARWGRLHRGEKGLRNRRDRLSRNRRADRYCLDCGVMVGSQSRTGRCKLHAPAVRYSYVPMVTGAAWKEAA
jgi:hypothetical protein